MISIQKSGDTINFTFTDSSHYLYGNGTISVPENSLTLTIDESDIVNFKKADSNDIFISATLGEFGKTKAELIEFYKENMVNAGISSGDVETMISSATSGFADSVSYNSTTKYVEFFNGNTKVFEYDASEFVIDGMVDNVEIKTISSGGTNVDVLAITFNVESGKNEIDIPLSDIFDPDLYYTKTEVDSALSGKADTSAVTADIAAAVSGKVDTSAFTSYSGSIETKLSEKVDTSAFTSYSGSIESRLSEDEEVTSAALNALNETVEGKVDASAITSAVTSGSTDAEIPTAKAVYDAIPQGGGGKAVSGGTNISITTGETADTINCKIPYSDTIPTNSDIILGKDLPIASDYNRVCYGKKIASRENSLFDNSIGIGVPPSANSSDYNELYGSKSIGIGGFKIGNGSQYSNTVAGCVAIGYGAKTRISDAVAIGHNTEASGTTKTNINNQLKIDTSNQVYISNSANTSTYCLQEKIENTEAALGGLKLVQMTQSEYEALANKDANTIYYIVN